MLTAMIVLFRSIGLMCRGHRAAWTPGQERTVGESPEAGPKMHP